MVLQKSSLMKIELTVSFRASSYLSARQRNFTVLSVSWKFVTEVLSTVFETGSELTTSFLSELFFVCPQEASKTNVAMLPITYLYVS
jgi:hypothetical protein